MYFCVSHTLSLICWLTSLAEAVAGSAYDPLSPGSFLLLLLPLPGQVCVHLRDEGPGRFRTPSSLGPETARTDTGFSLS